MKQAERNKTLDGQRIMFSVKISPPRKDLSLDIVESLTSYRSEHVLFESFQQVS
jgi:hypothetical protein